MAYTTGDTLRVTVDGETRRVTVCEETFDGLLLVTENCDSSAGTSRYTIEKGAIDELLTRRITFGIYDEPGFDDGPFAVMNQERPDIPRGTLEAIQEHVESAVDDGELTVDGSIMEAGVIEYRPGKEDGSVDRITIWE